ncbi:MAG: DUF192 domain-containing protein [Proteobacteria bacterium]|nr:DUF192 domain-containing protein [Pseudomonadota bacterium]MBU1743101.1 DUF192 domain-containing protein [Pseudomonadota bacterium]
MKAIMSPFLKSSAALILAGGLFVGATPARAEVWRTGDRVLVEINRLRVRAVVAADDRTRDRGLGGVTRLPPGRGMLFVFGRPQELVFWMKGMLIAIDIIFIRAGRVVKLVENIRPPTMVGRVLTTGPPVRADMVLEVRAGEARRHGLEVGHGVTLSPLPGGR